MQDFYKLTDTDPFFVIKWRLLSACNYNCSYCIRSKQDELFHFDKGIYIDRLKEAARRINIKTDRPIKIDLIGGEVSLLPLDEILAELKFKPDRIQITTNLSQPVEYYNNLADKYNLSITASFHPEYNTLPDFIDKCKKLHPELLSLEMVSTKDNQTLAREFVKKCKENDFFFKLERDIRAKRYENDGTELLVDAKMPDNRPRFIVDGRSYKTRNDFLTTSPLCSGNRFHSKGLTCRQSFQYMYIEIDELRQCGQSVKIEEFESKEVICPVDYCSLCGHTTIQK